MIDLILMCIGVILWFIAIVFCGYLGVTIIKDEEKLFFKICGSAMLLITLMLVLAPFSGVF